MWELAINAAEHPPTVRGGQPVTGTDGLTRPSFGRLMRRLAHTCGRSAAPSPEVAAAKFGTAVYGGTGNKHLPVDGATIAATKASRPQRRGGAAGELRRQNLGAVLERLHLSGPLSRSELTTSTGLNRSTIAALVGELGELGLVEERGTTPASGPGRPSPLVHTRPEGAVALAIELVVDSLGVATVGLGGHVYNLVRIARSTDRFSPEETVQDVVKLAGPLLDALPRDHVLSGVGAAVAGTTRRVDGVVTFAPNLGWRDVPLATLLEEELGLPVPVSVANEADLGALAEHRRGARPGTDHLLYISGEVGIGCGAIVDGRPLLGAAGYAGEAGHMMIRPDGRTCRCGARGCWETEAGEAALLRRAGVPAGGGIDEVAARATAGDEPTLRALDEVGRWLGLGIGNLVNLFNPELIVLGGVYEHLFACLERSMTDAVRTRVLASAGEMASIVRSGLGSDAALLGAAELALSEVLADPARRRGARTSTVPARAAGAP
jgi:predicted NBD/HSP70 family sugar kinase